MILDVGCGRNKYPGAIGVDRNPATAADVVCDLDRVPYPFRGGRFDQIRVIHVIEHVADVIATMEELHRLCRPGGRILIETPHYTDFSSFCDPTHRWHLNSFSFRYFGERHGGFAYYSPARMREVRVRVKLLRLWKLLGFELAINHSLLFRRFWEHYLCFLIRGKAVVFVLEVLKDETGGHLQEAASGG